MQSVLQSVIVEKYIKKCQKVGLMQIPGDYETLSIVRHVGLHVDFSFMKSSLDP